jgi:hypothetical protein
LSLLKNGIGRLWIRGKISVKWKHFFTFFIDCLYISLLIYYWHPQPINIYMKCFSISLALFIYQLKFLINVDSWNVYHFTDILPLIHSLPIPFFNNDNHNNLTLSNHWSLKILSTYYVYVRLELFWIKQPLLLQLNAACLM